MNTQQCNYAELRPVNYRVTRYPWDCVRTMPKQCCSAAKEIWALSQLERLLELLLHMLRVASTVSLRDAVCGEDVLWVGSWACSRCWQASCFSALYTATTWPWIAEANSIASISTLIPAKERRRRREGDKQCEGNPGLHFVRPDLRDECGCWFSYCRLWQSLCLCDLLPGTCWVRGRERCSTVSGWQGKTWRQLTAHERRETQ